MGKYSYTQSSFSGGVWSRSLWHRFTHEQYPTSCRESSNFFSELHGTLKKRTGLKYSHKPKVSTYNGTSTRLYTFKAKSGASYILEFGDLTIRFINANGQVTLSGSPFELATVYTSAELPFLRFTQNENKLYISIDSHDEYILTYNGTDTGWTLTTPTYGALVATPTGLTSSTGTNFKMAVSAVKGNEESVPTSLISPVTMNTSATLTWNLVGGADRYYVYQYNNGLWQSVAIVGQPTSGTTVTWTMPAAGVTPDANKGVMTNYNYFSGTGNKPTCSTFFQQRKFSANTINNPKRIIASRIGNPISYDSSSPHIDSDAIVADIIDTDYNQIKYLVPGKKLVALGESGEYIVGSSSSTNEAITNSTIDAPCVTRVGCGDAEPQMVENSILFFNTSNQELNQYAYSLADDGYSPLSLTVLAQHLFDTDQAKEMCFSKKKLPRLFVITDTGKCYCLVYSKNHKIAGWFEFKTAGTFESVAVMKRSGKNDRIYFCVNRGDGQGKFIEYIEDENLTDETSGFYVDCGITQTNLVTPFTSVATPHLADGTVCVALADGCVYRNLVVTAGAVTLPYAANVAHVGLAYSAKLRTISPIMPVSNSMADKRGSIISAVVRLSDTRELLYGISDTDLIEHILRDADDGQATNLKTGSEEITLPASSQLDSDMWLASNDPVPLNIQSITYNVEANAV